MLEAVQAVFRETSGLPPEIDWQMTEYGSTPGWDSVAHMAFVAALENPRASAQTEILCRLYIEPLGRSSPILARNTFMIRYGHDDEITKALSAICDLRVIWVGDATVNAIRAISLEPHARNLAFRDRSSLCAIQAERYLDTPADQRARLALRFYNDLFWFDQMACSSPRLLVWCGAPKVCSEASAAFSGALLSVIAEKHPPGEISNRINLFTFACQAILDGAAGGYSDMGPHLTLLHLDRLANFRKHHGGGLLFQFQAPTLAALAGAVQRKGQTLTYSGFNADELRAFAELLNGRGIDRVVPIGSALAFHRHWDGWDLLAELTRYVDILPEGNSLDG